MVRLLSTVHATKQDKNIAELAWSTAFSRRYFSKTLAATCLFAFGSGFYGMQRLQQNRQWKWEQKQEELEDQFYKIHNRTKNVPVLPPKIAQ
jgi:hypothetical protein